MAGIGLHLRRVLQQETLSAYGACALYGCAVGAGPWLVLVAALWAFLRWPCGAGGAPEALSVCGAIFYSVGFAGIAAAPWVLISVRQAADAIYVKRLARIPATLHLALAGAAASAILVGTLLWLAGAGNRLPEGAYPACLPLGAVFAVNAVLLGAMGYVQWIKPIALVVLVGGAVSWLGGAAGGRVAGIPGMLLGFAAGALVTAAGLYAIWRVRCPRGQAWDARFLGQYRRLREIGLARLLYQLGLWSDKISVWLRQGTSGDGAQSGGVWPYLGLTVLASFFVLPALAYLVVGIEARFVERYRRYLAKVHRGTLAAIEQGQEALASTLFAGLGRLIEYQSVALFMAMLWASPILRAVGFDAADAPLFCRLLIAAFGQVMTLAMVTFLLYFERRREAVLVAGLMALMGFVLCGSGFDPGFGAAVAACVSALVGWAVLRWRAGHLTYLIFVRQPAG